MDKTTKAFVIGACSVVILGGAWAAMGVVNLMLAQLLSSQKEAQAKAYRLEQAECERAYQLRAQNIFKGTSQSKYVRKIERNQREYARCVKAING